MLSLKQEHCETSLPTKLPHFSGENSNRFHKPSQGESSEENSEISFEAAEFHAAVRKAD
jgi:hypothetical protein